MIKNLLTIGLNTLIVILILEFGFKIYDLSQPDYFDNKKNIISHYSNFANHPFINYTIRKNTAGKQIHYEPGVYFQTTTNSDGFRTKRFLPKLDETFRVILIGDSFVYGMNANDNETLAVQLEKNYQKNISKKIEVLSLGVIGYSALSYAGIARTYFDYLKPDLVIVCIDSGDFNEDINKLKNFDYQFDDQGYPYFIKDYYNVKKFGINVNREIEFFENKNITLIHKLKLESSLFNKLNYLRHKIKNIRFNKRVAKISKEKIPYLDYEKLTAIEKKDLHKILSRRDILAYDFEQSKAKYKVSFKSLEYVKNKSDEIGAETFFSTYPYAWHINPEYSKLFQMENFNNILDFRNNHVYQELVNYYAAKLGILNLDSIDFFIKNPGKYWGDYDPHFNASGYKLYAKFLYQQTEKFIKENLRQ
jgi:hypothetical protein